MAKPIIIKDFLGMNNVKQSEGEPNEPAIVLNSFVTPQGRILKKNGYTSFVSLAGAHSLYASSVMLCVAAETLYRVDNGTATSLCSVNTHGSKMSYVEVNDKIYMSCKGWNGIYDLSTKEVTSWGLTIPDKPTIAGIDGDIPPGTYSICYTAIDDNNQISGNSEIVQVSFENQTMGLSLIRRPLNCLVWMTDTNGGEYYLVGNTTSVSSITSVYNSIPLLSLDVIPPPKMTNLCLFAGRIWGISGKKLYYSEAGIYEWFKNANSFDFPEELVGVSVIDSGLYVHSKNTDWVLAGTDPLKMQIKRVGNGIVSGTQIYTEAHESGEEGAALRHKRQVPVWIGRRGLTIGGQQSVPESLTEEKLNIPFTDEGAGLSLKQNGINQLLFTLKVSKNLETDLNTIFEDNSLF